jgi:hypothetical protein
MSKKTTPVTVTFTRSEAEALFDNLNDIEAAADNNRYLGQKQRDLYDAARIRLQQVMYPGNFS